LNYSLNNYFFKEQDKLVHQNKCKYLENINFIWKPLWKHTLVKQKMPCLWKDTDVHVYSNAFLVPWSLPLNQVLSLMSNILQLNVIEPWESPAISRFKSLEMQLFYNNAATNLSVTCLFKLKEILLILHLLWHFSHYLAISLTFIDATTSA
jgi:hypothetical protein